MDNPFQEEGEGGELEEDTLIILGDSGMASPPVPPISARATPFPDGEIDLQGIPWGRAPISRAAFRLRRMREMALLQQGQGTSIYIGEDLIRPIDEQPPIFEVTHMNRTYPCTVQHFQLRHLLWSSTSSSVNFTCKCKRSFRTDFLDGNWMMEWDPVANTESARLNFRDYCGAHSRISTICATPELYLVGGFYGELVYSQRYQQQGGNAQMKKITRNENGITNFITPFHEAFPARFLISSNDAQVRLFDAEAGTIIPLARSTAPINAAGLSPCGRLLCLCTDSTNVNVLDIRSEQVVMQLTGHTGYTFSCSWHPAGSLLATGNEDHSARIYDIRKPESSTHVLGARMAAIRSVRFSPSGDCLAVMEMTDFVTFYNATTSFNHSTTLDFFGECSGVDFSPNGEYAYVGCAEAERGGIIEMKRPSMGWLSTINEYFL